MTQTPPTERAIEEIAALPRQSVTRRESAALGADGQRETVVAEVKGMSVAFDMTGDLAGSEGRERVLAAVEAGPAAKAAVRLYQNGAGPVAIISGATHKHVEIVRISPLTHPDQYIAILDEDGEELHVIDDVRELDRESQETVGTALRQRYMTAIITRIVSVRHELGISYFEVETDRGSREFVVQNLLEGARWLSDQRLLIFDVDGNRFEIPELDALDKKSHRLLHTVL